MPLIFNFHSLIWNILKQWHVVHINLNWVYQHSRTDTIQTYIRNDVAFCIKNDISLDEDETLWLELHLPKTKPIIIGTCYPPKQKNSLDQFENN